MPAQFTKGAGLGTTGFDKDRNLQVVQMNKKVVVYLADGADETVQIQNESAEANRSIIIIEEVDQAKLSAQEKKANYRKFVITGVELGATKLTAGSNAVPFKVTVVKNDLGRVFDGGTDVLPPQLVASLKGYGLRGAAIRIAEDQMHSSVGSTSSKGAGMYMSGKDEKGNLYDWCGGFVQWCYQQAAKALGVSNPFGDTAWALASPQRAISWAMAHPSLATVVRYKGGNPMDADGNLYGSKGSRVEKQDMVEMEIAAHGNPSNITEGDICLLRNSAGGWQHVCMVYNVAGTSTFDTINGNPTIWIDKNMKYADKVGNDYKYTFLHLSLPQVDWVSGWMAESQTAIGP